MPHTPNRGTVPEVAKAIGRGTTAVYKYIKQTRGLTPDPLDLVETPNGVTLDVEKTAVYAASRSNGRPPQWKGQNA